METKKRKYWIVFFSWLLFYCTNCLAIGDPQIQNMTLTYANGELTINYDMINASGSKAFYITAEIYKSPGEQIGPITLKGNVNTVIQAGANLQITWNILEDGIILDNDVIVKIHAQPVTQISTGKSLGLSALYPGWGDYYLPKHKAAWLKGFFTYGLLGGGIYFNFLSASTYNQYQQSYDPGEIQKLYDKSSTQQYISYALMGSAAVFWTIDKIVLATKIHKAKEEARKIGNRSFFNNDQQDISGISRPFHINNKTPLMIALENGEKQFNEKDYRQAKKEFLAAQKMDPFAVKPKVRIAEINAILAEQIPERGLPPYLFVDMLFEDDNNNHILDALETGYIKMRITNKGKGTAYRITTMLEDTVQDPELTFSTGDIPLIDPEETAELTIPIKAGLDVVTARHKVKISITEYFGYNLDPVYLEFTVLAYNRPQLVFSGMEINDHTEGTFPIFSNGQLEPGERVKIKIVIQNIGLCDALNTSYFIYSKDENIYVDNGFGNLGNIKPGEIREFIVDISPNKKVEESRQLPVFLSLREEVGKGSLIDFQLPIFINQRPEEVKVITIKPDIMAITKEVAEFITESNRISAIRQELVDIWNVEPSKTKRPNSVGIVIGIENYRNLMPAPYADNDAELMKKYFEKRFGIERVLLYKEDQVIGFIFDNIFNSLDGEIQRGIKAGESEVFVFYSGHGIPGPEGENIYLFPSDGKISRLEVQGYNLRTLYENLNNLGAKNVVVILDACFTGASRYSERIGAQNLIASKGVKIKTVDLWKDNPKFTVITSSGMNETSLAYDLSETGLFTYFLAAGLQGYADQNNDGKITLGELKKYILDNVTETSRKIRAIQTPEFSGDENQVLIEY